MCETDQSSPTNAETFLKRWRTATRAVVFGLLCGLPVSRAAAQVVTCVTCPSGAQAAGVAPGIFITRASDGSFAVPSVQLGAGQRIVIHTDRSYTASFPEGVIG